MKTYTISITFTDQQAKNPIEAVENFIEDLKEYANSYIYDVEDEETGEKFTVDMGEDDEDKVLPLSYLELVKIPQTENKNFRDMKTEIEILLIDNFDRMTMDIPSNFDDILEFVYQDVKETADQENWNDSDVVIGFRRFIESISV